MNAAKIEQLVTELKNEISTKLHHRTLLEHTGQPPIWEDQLFYLLLPKMNGEQWQESHQIAAQSVAMIQTALTTHDLVEEHDGTSKSQQLMVLAGDYYSGMYYTTLSKLPNIQFIREMSNVVAEISEMKTAFYESPKKAFQQWISQFESIVSKAIEQFMMHFQFTAYIDSIKQGMLISRLSKELQQLKDGTSTIRFAQAIAAEFNSEEQAILAIQREIQSRAMILVKEIRESNHFTDLVKTAILGRIEALTEAQHMTREG